jgi:hypothetical protein
MGGNSMINKQKAIDDIIDNFKWEKVYETMVALNWKWWDSEDKAPSIGQLLRCAIGLLNNAYDGAEKEKRDYGVSTGGFCARAIVDDETKEIIELRLVFEVCSWEYYE